jgi:alpha-L-rhamnosidase
METGDLEASREAWPRLVRQLAFLEALVGDDDLLPVENLGVPTVWIDHLGFRQQRHKRCAFNLYAIAMLRDAMAPLARVFADAPVAERAESLAARLHAAALAAFWDADLRLFVDNRPWLAEDGGPRTHDRTLATAVLHHLAPDDNSSAMVAELAAMPERCGRSYPANAGWRLHALAQAGRSDVVVGDLRTRWAGMASVLGNTSLQEDWVAHPDSGQEWSHCPLDAFNALIQDVIGLRPTSPGFAAWRLQPRLADLGDIEFDAHTVGGCFRIRTRHSDGERTLEVAVPGGVGTGDIIGVDGGRRSAAPGTVVRLVC